MPKKGDAVCLAAGQAHEKLRAGRGYTVCEVGHNIGLTDAATGKEISGYFKPSLLAPAEEVAVLALHCALYLGREDGVVLAVLEAHREVRSG